MAAVSDIPLISQSSLPDFYVRVLQQFQALHAENRLSDDQLARITAKAGPDDVLEELQRVVNQSHRDCSVVTRFIGRVTEAVLQRIERFNSVVDICIQSNPKVSALVWGCVKFLVIVAQDIFGSFERVCELVEGIIFAVVRFSKYLNIFQKRTELLAYIFKFYEKILAFAAEAVELYTRSTWRTLVKALWTSIEAPFRSLMQQINEIVDEIDKTANAEHMADQEAMRKDVEIVRRILENTLISNAHPPIQSYTKIWMVPDLLHAHFTGRADQLLFLKHRFFNMASNNGQRRAAIYGIPGVGKSQLGMKYFCENRPIYKHSFFISARSELAIVNDFCRIASILCLPQATMGAEAPLQVDAVLQWFCKTSDGGNGEEAAPWIILYDNISADDLIVLRRRYLPPCEHGHVLFTTRDKTVAQDLVNDDKNAVLYLEQMSEEESIELLLSASGEDITDSESLAAAKKIVKSVSGLPIALDQVASFSKRGGKPLSTSFERLRLQKNFLLSHEDPMSKYETNSKNKSTTAMIQIALEDSNKKFGGASLFFKLLCFFGQEYVPISFLTGNGDPLPSLKAIIDNDNAGTLREPLAERKRDRIRKLFKADKKKTRPGQTVELSDPDENLLSSLFSDINQVEAAIDALKSTGLLQQTDKVLWIHDLFTAIGVDNIVASQKHTILFIALRITSRVFSQPDYGDLPKCREYLDFALKSADSADASCHRMHHDLGTFFLLEGNYEESYAWYGRALAGHEKALGKDHPSTLDTVHNMACIFDNQGRYDEALEWYGRALAGCEKALGKDHPSTLTTVHNMACVFDNQGRYDEALEWYGRALAGHEKALGKDHPSTLATVHNMACVFDNQGRYDEALKWYGRALAGREKALGKDHPSTLDTVHNMACIFDNQGRYDEALEWYGRALAGHEKALGKDHPSTLDTVHNMAYIFGNQGRYDEALEWYGRALAGHEKALGKDHPSTLDTVHNMACVFDNQGRYDEALEWYGRALAGCEKALGKDHPSTKITSASIFGLQARLKGVTNTSS